MGDSSSAVNHFEESIEFLMKLPMNDLEVLTHWFLLYYDFANFYHFVTVFAKLADYAYTFCLAQ